MKTKINWPLVLFLTFCLVCGVLRYVFAADHESSIVRTIMGEAADQGEESMRAHGHAIMNRGMMGAHGRSAKHTQTGEAYQKADKAWWDAMREPDTTGGATHWLSKEDIAQKKRDGRWCKWNREFIETITIKDTTFFKRRKK